MVAPKVWTEKEEELLRESYGRVATTEIAELLGKDYSTTNSKIQYMKKTGDIQRENRFKCSSGSTNKIDWSERDVFIIKNDGNISRKEMAKKLNLKLGTLYKRIYKLIEQGKLSDQGIKKRERKTNNVLDKIAELDGNMQLGRKYKIERLAAEEENVTKNFSGKLIQVTEKFYTFKNKTRIESFLKVDFVIGSYSIREV